MRYYIFSLSSAYLIQPKLRGNNIFGVSDSTFSKATDVFRELESMNILIPENQSDFKEDLLELFAKHSISVPNGFISYPTQYFITCQIYDYLSSRLDPMEWEVTREHQYSEDSNHSVDVKIYNVIDNFSIWIESDNAREDQLYKKLWEKLPIILRNGNPESDYYVPFIYTNNPSQKAQDAIRIAKKTMANIENNITIHRIETSFSVFNINKLEHVREIDSGGISFCTGHDRAIIRIV